MSIRHIYAKPGQHIRVHRRHRPYRNYPRYTVTSYQKETSMWKYVGYLLLGAGIIWFVITFWVWLLTIALTVAGLWLMWKFRSQLWRFTCWTCRGIFAVVRWCCQRIFAVVRWCRHRFFAGRAIPQQAGKRLINVTLQTEERIPGKIVQHRRN